jgi:hypothetical protein
LTTMPPDLEYTRVLVVPKSIAKSAENKLNNGRRLLMEIRVNQSKCITPTGLIGQVGETAGWGTVFFCPTRQGDWLAAHHRTPIAPIMGCN